MAKYTVIVRELIARRGEIEVEAASVSEAYAIIKSQIISEILDMRVFEYDIAPTVDVDIVDIEET